ncbi:MAG: HAD family hydrolase [Candidatus Dormibacteraeota bacterium]|nr:HAD family hydrolase [Candidatus Dormibacteraeota bacterium]
MGPTVLLLDIDGTLVDNTAQHIAAWWEAFVAEGLSVDSERLRPEIGKGGDLFVKGVAGEAWEALHGDAAREHHSQAYKRLLSQVRPVAGARDFLKTLHTLGIRPVLATSSDPDEVEANLKLLGETPERFLIVDRDDIGTSKPAPDAFALALKRSGATASQAAAVGDTRWDGESAGKSGIRFYGLLTGAGTREDLQLGGAREIFADLPGLGAFLERR